VTHTSAVVVAKTRDVAEQNICRLKVYSDPDFKTLVFESDEPVQTDASSQWIVKLSATDLKPSTTYFYRIEVNGEDASNLTGRVKTCPPPTGGSFAIAFGNSNNDPDSPVYDWLKSYDPLFFINTGDFHYRDINDADESIALKRHQEAYELNLNVRGGARNQADLYRHTAFGYMWDDHDFGPNDCHAKGSSPAHRTTKQAQAAAHRVYRRYIPHWPLPLESNPAFEPDRAPIAQAFSVGRVRFIFSDLRSQSEQNGREDQNATLMGKEQKLWFKEELLRASGSHALIVWVSSVPWNGGQRPAKSGKWYEHTGERAEIANFLKDNHIRGFCAIGGDAHMTAIDDGSNTDFASGGGAGFPLIHAAPIGTKNSYKGGPYSEGASHIADNQFGAIEVIDNGDELITTLVGLNGPSRSNVIISAHSDNPSNPLELIFTNSWPLITQLTPADDSIEAPTDTTLRLQFNEPIQKGNGELRIIRLSDNKIRKKIRIGSSNVSVDGNTLTARVPGGLRPDTGYAVTADEGIVTDAHGHPFPGIYAPEDIEYKKWNFKTQ
jgi:phosphodiesterase/alkaline phosphatase D-like protein